MSGKLTNAAVNTPITTPAGSDLFYIVRPSDGAAGSHSITEANLQAFINANMALRIFTDVANHPNVLAAATVIETITIPAGSLRAAGDFLEYVMEFDAAGNANSKTIRYTFDTQPLNAAPWNNTIGSTQGVQIGRVYRVTDTTCRCYIANTLPFLAQTTPFTQFGDITVSDMDVTNIDFVVSLQGAASNDITHRVSHMYLTRA